MVYIQKCQRNNYSWTSLSSFFPFFFFLSFFCIFLIIEEEEEDKEELKETAKKKETRCLGQSKFLCLQFSAVKSYRIWIAGYLAVYRNQMMRCLNFITLSTVNCALTVLLSPNCRHKRRDCLQSYSKHVPKQNL